MRKVFVPLFFVLAMAGCGPVPPPQPPVPPPSLPDRVIQATVRGSAGEAPEGTAVQLTDDASRVLPCVLVGSRAVCTASGPHFYKVGGHLEVTAPGYQSFSRAFYLDGGDQNLADVPLVAAVPPSVRLHVQGRHGLHDPAGRHVPVQAVTAFQLTELMAHGREGEADAFVKGMGAARFARILVMAANLFVLSPGEGLAALPATLDLLAHHGRYAEVVIFADTGSYPGLDYRATASQVGAICAQKPSCATVELGNELFPLHETQDDELGDLEFLKELRTIVRQHGDIPVSLGSSHGSEEEEDTAKDGDYLTVHGSRADGDQISGDDSAGWRWVRHANEQRALADRVNKWVWGNEPRRNDFICGKHLGLALLLRLFRIGDTFHYRSGLFALPMDAGEQAAFACRARGWSLIPDDWFGVYANTGAAIPRSPVKSFEGAVRAYSSINGNHAYTLVLGAEASVRLDWDDSWPVRELVVNDNNVQLWKVSR